MVDTHTAEELKRKLRMLKRTLREILRRRTFQEISRRIPQVLRRIPQVLRRIPHVLKPCLRGIKIAFYAGFITAILTIVPNSVLSSSILLKLNIPHDQLGMIALVSYFCLLSYLFLRYAWSTITGHTKRKYVCSSCIRWYKKAILLILVFLLYFFLGGFSQSVGYMLLGRNPGIEGGCATSYRDNPFLYMWTHHLVLASVIGLIFGAASMVIFLTALAGSLGTGRVDEEKIDYSFIHSSMRSCFRHRNDITKGEALTTEKAKEICQCLENSLKIIENNITFEKQKSEEEMKMYQLKRILDSAYNYFRTRLNERNIEELRSAIESQDRPKVINTGALCLYQIWRVFKDMGCDYEESRSNIHTLTIFVLGKNLRSHMEFYEWRPTDFEKSIGDINDEICDRFLNQSKFHETTSDYFITWIYNFSDVGLSDFEKRRDDVDVEKKSFEKMKHLVLIDQSALEMKKELRYAKERLEKDCEIFYVGQKNRFPSLERSRIINNDKELKIQLLLRYNVAASYHHSLILVERYAAYLAERRL